MHAPPLDATPLPDAPPAPPAARRRLGAGAGLVGIGVASGAWCLALLVRDQRAWQAPLLLWLLGLASTLAGAAVLDWRRAERAAAGRPTAAVVGALVVGVLALLLRLFRLGEVPPGIFVDETNSALDALALLFGRPASPFATGWYETPNGYIYLQAAIIGLLGPTFLALKLPGVLAGVLTVLGVFALGHQLFSFSAGLVAALFMAFAMWPLNMSRWGWNENVPPAAHVWTLFFLVRGARTGRTLDFALAGLVLGLGMYSYLSIRLVVVAVLGYLAYRAVVERRFLPAHAWRLALFALVWALTFAPLAVTYATQPQTFFNRSGEVSIQRDIERAGSLEPLVENARRHLLMFTVAGDRNPRHNIPGEPMLDPIMGALFLLALARSALLLRDHRRGLLVLWIPAVLLGGMLSSLAEGPQAYRTLGVMPAVALLCGELVVSSSAWARAVLGRLRVPSRLAAGGVGLLLAALLGTSAWLNLDTYFGRFARDPRVYAAFTPHETAVAREIASAANPDSYYLSPRLYYFSTPRYFAAAPFHGQGGRPGQAPFHPFWGLDDLPLRTDGQTDAVLLLEPDWSPVSAIVRSLYPAARVETVRDPTGALLYERVTIPAGDLPARALPADGGLLGTYYAGEQWNGEILFQRVDPLILFAWPDAKPVAGPFSVRWDGEIEVPVAGSYTFLLNSDDGARLWLDGRVVGEALRPDSANFFEVRLQLSAGRHPIRVEYFQRGGAKSVSLRWVPPGQPAHVVPAQALHPPGR